MTPAVDFVLDASVILLATLAILPLLRRRSAAARHFVLAAALLSSATAPVVGMLLPAWVPPLQVPLPAFSAAATPLPGQALAPPPPPAASAAAVTAASHAPLSLDAIVQALPFVWAAGVALFAAWLAIGLARLVYLTREARAVTDGPWLAALEWLRAGPSGAPPVRMRESHRPQLLLVWGWRRPTLLVPVAARTWSSERIAAVLRHELAHVRRQDWLMQVAAEAVRAVYWFNPLVWIACARLHVECERACDDEVLDAGVEGPRYAGHLLDIARDVRQTTTWAPAPAIVRPSTLERRVKAMLDQTLDRRPLSRRARTTSLAALVAASIAVGTLAAAQQFATVGGTIVDATNGLLPGVTLVLVNDQTKAKYEITSDRNGRYEFVGLPAGTYTLETKLPGFAVFRGSLTVAGQPIQQDLALAIGELQETISIVGGAVSQSTPEELRARDVRRAAEQEKVAEMMQKRAAAKCPPAPPAGVATIGGNLRVPVKLRDMRPVYPERLQGVDGNVVLAALIGTDGRVVQTDVVSATHPEFAASLSDAVRQWVFDATVLNCTPVETRMRVSGSFRWAQ